MNPLEFNWTEDQNVTVTNPTGEPYRFKVHNKDYELGAGKTARMPGYIAWVYVYGLATQLAQQDGVFNRWNEEDFRPTYYNKLISGVDAVVQNVETVEPEPEVTTFDEADTNTELEPETPTGGENYVSPFEAKEAVQPMKAQPKAKALRNTKA